MGIGPTISGFGDKAVSGNPDPANFKLLKFVANGDYMALLVNYPDATNFEGDKILVVKGKPSDFMLADSIDPHFEKGGYLIARFIPNGNGWAEATLLVDRLAKYPLGD